jgi:hypothetical protein
MSKKKNTLKDLDEFLKQQASSLSDPAPLRENRVSSDGRPSDDVSIDKLLDDLKALTAREGDAFRPKFYDLIIRYLQSQRVYSAEDKMLINTALYLKSGDNWKDAIRQFWRENQ